jgi:hypothetical protein
VFPNAPSKAADACPRPYVDSQSRHALAGTAAHEKSSATPARLRDRKSTARPCGGISPTEGASADEANGCGVVKQGGGRLASSRSGRWVTGGSTRRPLPITLARALLRLSTSARMPRESGGFRMLPTSLCSLFHGASTCQDSPRDN